ncbi:DUF3080 family protein [Billgrantia montanilacus]|uniref:DUF3080 family protein n=1 Tax=Billgrantia montanilacus TaxID=2282305 RepID=A0A368U5B2_9GAMM|nr:DUF3080 family protein [Halomonas montanilacus]RCV91292.1 DUF3080 family protein [Halomonas montanilacus]
MAGLMTAALLVGCGGSGEGDALLTSYQRDLAEALGQPEPQPSDPINIGAFPDRRERLFEIPETRESMLDVYALRECHITSLVAARNNQLGRVAPPSQRWIYELELWRRLHGCWNSEVPAALSENNRDRLARLTMAKTEQLPLVSWNTLFDSDEWTGSFSRASSPLEPDSRDAIDEQLAAIEWLHAATLNQFSQEWQHASSTLEGHLDTLRRRPLTAEVLRALLLAEQRLGEANTLLEASLADTASCQPLAEAGSELKSLFQQKPAAEWLDDLEALANRWLGAIDALLESHVPPPKAVAHYRGRWLSLNNPAAPLPAFLTARDIHRRHWQALAERCE